MRESNAPRTPIVVLLIAAAVALLAFWGFQTSEGAEKAREREARLAAAEGGTEEAPTLEVETLVARTAPAIQIVELAGRLEPVRTTWVAAEIAGRIVDVPTAEFSRVEEGGVLVRLDDALPRADLVRAEASHRLARAELTRQERLGRSSVASEAELERAAAEERSRYAALLEARTRLGHTRIRAPFDGLVNALDLDPGAYVQPGTRIAEVLDVSTLEVTVLVGDRQIGSLRVGERALVRIDVLGNQTFEGGIARVAGAPQDGGTRYPVVVALASPFRPATLDASADTSPGMSPARIADAKESVSDSEDAVPARVPRPGMLAQVRFEIGREPAIRLPRRAVLREFELDYVFVLDDEARAKRVRVGTRPVPFRPDQLEIIHGLDEGDRIAVTAVDQLRSGLRVILR